MLIRYGNEPQLSQFGLLCNTEESGLFSNVSSACKRDLKTLEIHAAHDQKAIVCGGGPSLEDSLESIREMKAKGGKVFALNNAAEFLTNNGIKVDAQVILDPRWTNVKFIQKAWGDEVYLCSQCHPRLFDHCEEIGYPVVLWHPALEGIAKHIPYKEPILVTVSLTVGLSCLSLIHTLGFRDFQLFGYDSSLKDARTHVYEQQLDDAEEIVRCTIPPGHVFYSSLAMSGQAHQFREVMEMLEREGSKVTVHGEGLLPTLWRTWQAERASKVLTAVYDLGVSPPSYDFLSFLIEAERHRKEHGYTEIDVVFQPGPMHGFRDDDLPPDPATRNGMLWRVCVGMAKLLPSVRNIEVKRVRWNLGDLEVFPPDYSQENPRSHYATAYLKNAEPMLTASEYAKARVGITHKYATITLRQSSYWPERNSNLEEWIKVAIWLWGEGIEPVFIPDTEGQAPEGFKSRPEASYDIDLRAALYQGAVVNLGVLNGPMSLIPYLGAPYIICKVVVESAVATTKEFLKAHGFEEGDDFGGNGKMIWKPDLAENIIPALQAFLTEKTS